MERLLSDTGGETVTVGEHASLNRTAEIALWVGFLGNAFSTIGFIYATKYAKKETIIFYNLNTIICSIGSVCYLLMTLGQSNYYTADGELVFWARYLEFVIATPLLLIDLGLVAGATIPELFYICICDVMMIACGWWGTIATTTAAKWIFFACGSGYYIPIVGTILGTLRTEIISQRSKDVIRLYNFLSVYTIFIWTGYPILWILHDGFHLINLDVECIIHTILDILAKGIFGAILVYSHTAFEVEEEPVVSITDRPTNDIELQIQPISKNTAESEQFSGAFTPPLPASPLIIPHKSGPEARI